MTTPLSQFPKPQADQYQQKRKLFLVPTFAFAPGVPDEGQALGTVFLGVAMGDTVGVHRVALPGDRNRLRAYAVISLLNFLRRTLAAD